MAIHDVRLRLLELHKTIVDASRREYEWLHGRQSDPAFLEVLLRDPAFAWLGPLTALIVALDEASEQNASLDAEWISRIRKILTPDASGPEFNRKYGEFTQRVPDILVAHGAVMHALKSAEAPRH